MSVASIGGVSFFTEEEPIPDTERAPRQSLITTEAALIRDGVPRDFCWMARVAVARALGFTFGGFAWVRTPETDTRVGRVWS